MADRHHRARINQGVDAIIVDATVNGSLDWEALKLFDVTTTTLMTMTMIKHAVVFKLLDDE